MSQGCVSKLRCRAWMRHADTGYRQGVIAMTDRVARRAARREIREAVVLASFRDLMAVEVCGRVRLVEDDLHESRGVWTGDDYVVVHHEDVEIL